MRVSILSLLPFALALASFANAHVDDDHSLSAREYLDALSMISSLERRELLEDLTTRELIDALSDRLDRRGKGNGQTWTCRYPMCKNKQYLTLPDFEKHLNWHFDEKHDRPPPTDEALLSDSELEEKKKKKKGKGKDRK
ncbi:hypothetical protein DFP72DRAFT_1139886 [Ephemerocybe angulata]|uniref:C2H2-type domain-containing protein n=1 Tax=Ephemerocybe angulata TaxID=980116 RepID=A0A8H6HQ02_9AGAR|nr:hypothetical protein DFP72DRAFT_1139886 [Tulosesus angulatus]